MHVRTFCTVTRLHFTSSLMGSGRAREVSESREMTGGLHTSFTSSTCLSPPPHLRPLNSPDTVHLFPPFLHLPSPAAPDVG
ncbi:hypothetical protein E2C01_042069 [Portunus trituberculatus]|uniref:Uncharacterized protein n=1 Tax=Portunus trituberculatus TaxID=210409 RepID=A0A5B7FLJ5_PORTR|nr:hypothetical protein [Portunus trituberculatus]